MCSAASRGTEAEKNLQGKLRLPSHLGELKSGSCPLFMHSFITNLFSLYLLSTSYRIETVRDVVILSQIRQAFVMSMVLAVFPQIFPLSEIFSTSCHSAQVT